MKREPPPIADPHSTYSLPRATVRRTWKTTFHVVVYLVIALLISWVDFAMAQVALGIGRGANSLVPIAGSLAVLLFGAAVFFFLRAWTVWKEGEPMS